MFAASRPSFTKMLHWLTPWFEQQKLSACAELNIVSKGFAAAGHHTS